MEGRRVVGHASGLEQGQGLRTRDVFDIRRRNSARNGDHLIPFVEYDERPPQSEGIWVAIGNSGGICVEAPTNKLIIVRSVQPPESAFRGRPAVLRNDELGDGEQPRGDASRRASGTAVPVSMAARRTCGPS